MVVAPGTATHLVFTTQPSNTLPLTAISPAVVVSARDAFENVDANFVGSVTMTIGVDGSGLGAHLTGTTTVAVTGGAATFGDLKIDLAGNGYTLVASAAGVTLATSNPFNISLTP